MKYCFYILALFCIACSTPSYSQVTNLIVNGSSTNFTMTSGDTVTWQFNIPTGSTALCGLWHDVNANGTIETNTDILFLPFSIADGDMSGDGGPPDMDGSVNGTIYFTMAVGLAPGNWIFYASQNSVSMSVYFEVFHLTSPAHVISGHINAPAGQVAKNLLVEMEPENNGSTFWHAISDSLGNYAIEMNADTSGNPWKIRLSRDYNPFPGYILSPEKHTVTITGNHSGLDFSYIGSAAKVTGILQDDDGAPITNSGVYLARNNNGNQFSRDVNTDANGFFTIGLASGELSTDYFVLGSGMDENNPNPPYLGAQRQVPGVHNGDSLYYTLIAYKVNSTIQGVVTLNNVPATFPIQVSAGVQDSAYTATMSSGTDGSFTLPASNKLYNYGLWANNLPSNYFVNNITVHPGQTGVIFNITVTDVKEREPGVPAQFNLSQNYPNPFNPSTVIHYDVPEASHVRLSIYSLLGTEVLNVVNQQQAPGKYTVTVDASSLPSGMYMYRIIAGEHIAMKKMILIK